MDDVLLINADCSPLNLIPLSTISWQRAVSDLWEHKIQVLASYDDWWVHSPSTMLQVPAVCMLKRQINIKRNYQNEQGGGPRSELIFLRDSYTCQYCERAFSSSHLTIDHVLPKSKGGKSTWQNCASCCEKCNSAKGNNEKIVPAIRPIRPNYYQLCKNRKQYPIVVPHQSWVDFLNWPEHLISVSTRKRN